MKMTLADVAAHQLRVEQGRRMKIDTAVSLLAEAKERETKKKTARLQAANGKSESDIQNEIERHLQSLGHRCYFIRCRMNAPTTFTRQGVPDFLIVLDGQPIALEVKRRGQKESREQAGELLWFNLAGGRAGIVHSLAEAVEFIAGKQISRTDSTEEQD